jgi:glycosyltransferase involved in cell wall biosynthesis
MSRPTIAFFDYPDVFEDFYPHYGVDQSAFVSTWRNTASHSLVELMQRELGDVVWYQMSLRPETTEGRHQETGQRTRIMRSSLLHRRLWRLFYFSKNSWRWTHRHMAYATIASYLAPLSFSLWRTIRRENPDLLFVESYSSGKFDVLVWLAKRLKVPVVAHHIGGGPEGYVGTPIRRRTLIKADRLLVSGAVEAERLTQSFGVDPARIEILSTPIDTDAFAPLPRNEAVGAMGLDPDRRYLLYVGRLQDGVKRISALIRCFGNLAPRYKNVDLLIAGTGPDEESLKRLAEEQASGRVQWLGWVGEPMKLAALYNSCECLLLPSRREGLPTVVAEAAACGTPVIASRTGGVPELISEGETGWMITPGDDSALLKATERVLANQDEVASMRPLIRERALPLVSPKAIAEQLQQIFSDLGVG